MATYSMREAIDKMLEESRWKNRYYASKIRLDWALLMGNAVANCTGEIRLQDGKLFITTYNASLKHELSFSKQLLIAKINQHLGENIVKDIFFT